jgi:hypothetical protein
MFYTFIVNDWLFYVKHILHLFFLKKDSTVIAFVFSVRSQILLIEQGAKVNIISKLKSFNTGTLIHVINFMYKKRQR